ncbi:MAG: hypothetical protein ACI32B_01565 [Erysipelotrichaceae bacterium]
MKQEKQLEKEMPVRKLTGEELYRFAAECCRYVEKQLANEREYFIVENQ